MLKEKKHSNKNCNIFGVDISCNNTNIKKCMQLLKSIYKSFPETTGCEKCKEINKEDEMWCCKTQTPSMWYCEFLYVWIYVKSTWSKERKIQLVWRAIQNYMKNTVSKGCIFFDNGCTVYEHRPLACRMYGIVPKESWDHYWETLKKRLGDRFDFRPQCDLVSLACPTDKMGQEEENYFFNRVRNVEKMLGVPDIYINAYDEELGSYRNFHDHLLLEIFDAETLQHLTNMKIAGISATPEKLSIDINI